jgi:hypothetical protein
MNDHKAEAIPILVILVDNQTNPGVIPDVDEPPERFGGEALRLFVHRRIDSGPVVRITDWNDVRVPARINCGHPGHAAGPNKCLNLLGGLHGIAHVNREAFTVHGKKRSKENGERS